MLSYSEFQHWFNTEYKKDLEDEASRNAEVYEQSVNLIEKELESRDKIVKDLQNEVHRLTTQLVITGLVAAKSPGATGNIFSVNNIFFILLKISFSTVI